MRELLREMEIFAAENHVPILQMRERKLLISLIEEAKPRRVLEIGTAIGYSALIMAMALPDKGKVDTIEINGRRAELAEGFIGRSPYAQKIRLLRGDAGILLDTLNGSYDFVFMDAAKGQYVKYFGQLQSLLSKNATIVADNVLFHGYVTGREKTPRRFFTMVKRLHEYIDMVEKAPNYASELLDIGDGILISRRLPS